MGIGEGGAVGVLSLFSSHEFAKVTPRMKKASVRVLQYSLPVKLVSLDEGGYLAVCRNLQGAWQKVILPARPYQYNRRCRQTY